MGEGAAVDHPEDQPAKGQVTPCDSSSWPSRSQAVVLALTEGLWVTSCPWLLEAEWMKLK